MSGSTQHPEFYKNVDVERPRPSAAKEVECSSSSWTGLDMTGDTAIPRSDPPCDSSQLGRAQPPGREASGATGVEAAVDVAVSDVVGERR